MVPDLYSLKPRSHCPGFQSRRRYGVGTGPYRDHTVATPASTTLNRDTPCWTGFHRVVAGCFLKQPGLTWTHRAAKQRRLIPGHHRNSSGMNRISTVRPPDDTVANRHELCPRWRAGVAPTLAGRTTVWHGSSRCMPVKLRWSYGMTTVQAGGRRLNYRNSIETMFV